MHWLAKLLTHLQERVTAMISSTNITPINHISNNPIYCSSSRVIGMPKHLTSNDTALLTRASLLYAMLIDASDIHSKLSTRFYADNAEIQAIFDVNNKANVIGWKQKSVKPLKHCAQFHSAKKESCAAPKP